MAIVCTKITYIIKDMFSKFLLYSSKQEQIEWAVEEGADYIVAETFCECGEALIAVKAVKDYGKGMLNLKKQAR